MAGRWKGEKVAEKLFPGKVHGQNHHFQCDFDHSCLPAAKPVFPGELCVAPAGAVSPM